MQATTLSMCLWTLTSLAPVAPLIARQTAPPAPTARDSSANEPAAAAQDFKFSPTLADIRQVATMIPGDRALRVNVLKFAESRRSKKFSIKGAPDEPSVQARTVFQVVYRGGTVMIDSGMDEQIHKFFGRGVAEPYDQQAAAQVARAVRAAKAIVVTHEHGDHVAGVTRTPFVDEVAPKPFLPRTQVGRLETDPQMPEIKLPEEMARHYIVIDYEK